MTTMATTKSKKTPLLIVESPGKCKKIESLTGIKCIASYGHFMDIPNDIKWYSKTTPEPPYEIRKENVAQTLRKYQKSKTRFIIASDMDREGEAIAENLMRFIKLDYTNTERLRFNQITKPALLQALNNPGRLDLHMFHAQQARRVIDILYGFLVSPVVSRFLNKRGLSAGRCQSPTVKLCLERQLEQSQETKKYFSATANIILDENTTLPIKRKQNIHHPDSQKVCAWMKTLVLSKQIKYVSSRSQKKKKNPPLPFTTSSFQQEVYRRFGIQPQTCMQIAQKLYETGYITYMRTDSIELSPEFKATTRMYIRETYGDRYVAPEFSRLKKTNKVTSQEAHEAIRPIQIGHFPTQSSVEEQKIFKIIWMRSVSFLMAAVEYDEHVASFVPHVEKVDEVDKEEIWEAIYTVQTFRGFLALRYKDGTQHQETDVECSESNESLANISRVFKLLKEGHSYLYKNIQVKQCVEHPPPPFSPADLIKTLEKTGIGRPSTYSSILDRIQKRGYVTLGENSTREETLRVLNWTQNAPSLTHNEYVQKLGGQKNIFIVTPLGEEVTKFLLEACNTIIQSEFTASLEVLLDKISRGELEWKTVVNNFYDELKARLQIVCEERKKQAKAIGSGGSKEEEKPMWVKLFDTSFESTNNKIGILYKYNNYLVAFGNESTVEKTCTLPPKTTHTNITAKEALYLMQLPAHVEKDMYLHLGRYGWYIQENGQNKGLGKLGQQRAPPTREDILSLVESSGEKSKKLKDVSATWSIWYNPKNQSHFLMEKNAQNKVSFVGLPNYNASQEYTENLCIQLKKQAPKKWRKKTPS